MKKLNLKERELKKWIKKLLKKIIKIYFIPHRKINKFYSKIMINKLRRNKTKNNIKNNKSISLKSLKTIKSLYDIKNIEPKINSEIIYKVTKFYLILIKYYKLII